MEEQSPLQKLRAKLSETIERSAGLLAEKKHYEFTQKIKMLAQRKQQTNKLLEAEVLFQLGIKKMLSQEQVDQNATHDLIIALLELYEANKTFWEKDKASELFKIITTKENERNCDYFLRILKNITNSKDAPEMAEYVINIFQSKKMFYKAQTLIVKEDLSRVTKFLQRWHEVLDNDQYAIVVCRMALLKGFQGESFDQSMVLLSELDTLNPFVKFTKFLILSVQMKSKQSYEKIGNSYKKFLKSDEFFSEIFDSYGTKFFKKQKGGMGILSLLEK